MGEMQIYSGSFSGRVSGGSISTTTRFSHHPSRSSFSSTPPSKSSDFTARQNEMRWTKGTEVKKSANSTKGTRGYCSRWLPLRKTLGGSVINLSKAQAKHRASSKSMSGAAAGGGD